MLADKFVNDAVFAAIRRLAKLRDFSDLQHQRVELARGLSGVRRQKDPCFCREHGPKIFGALPIYQPAIPLSASSSQGGEERLIPFPLVYLCWRVRNCSLPTIEMFEVPIPWNPNVRTIALVEMKRAAAGTVRWARMLTEVKSDEAWKLESTAAGEINAGLILEARKAVASECFEDADKFEFLNVSYPKLASAEVLSWANAYAGGLAEAEKKSGWEFHAERVLPVADRSDLKPLVWRTLAVRKRQLGFF